MLSYETFKLIIVERIKEFLPPIFQAATPQITIVRKVNEEKETLFLAPKDEKNLVAMPNIYLDDRYEEFKLAEDIDAVLESIATDIIRCTGVFPKSASMQTMKENIRMKKDAIVMNLINTQRNEELLKEIPHKEVRDLSIVYRIIMQEAENGFMTILVNNRLLEELELTLKELEKLAYSNTARMFPTEIFQMADFLYVMTNKQNFYGAATMINLDAMDKLAERVGSNFFIIPSSTHEIMAVPEKDCDADSLLLILKEANQDVCEANEILSDHIYYYDRLQKEITIAV